MCGRQQDRALAMGLDPREGSSLDREEVRNIIEAALLAASRPLDLDELLGLFPDDARPERDEIRRAITTLCEHYDQRGIELAEVASGFRIQVRPRYAEWVSRLWDEKPPRYSRALLETLALIAYRQPVTRGDIEDVRGVSVSTNIIRTLLERGWVRVVGHRDVPGHPEMFGTTKTFLDYFGLKRLDELPTLAEIREIAELEPELDFDGVDQLADEEDEHGGAQEGELPQDQQEGQPEDRQEDPPEGQQLEAAPAAVEDGDATVH